MLVAMESPSSCSAALEIEKRGILAQCGFENEVHLAALEIEIAVHDEVRNRNQMRVDDAMRARRIAKRDGVFCNRDDFVGGNQYVRRAGDDTRARHVFSILRETHMAQHRATLLREAGHVEDHAGLAFDMCRHAEQRTDGQHARAADTADRDVIGTIQ